MEPLSPRQQKALDYIRKEVGRCNYPPSVREICRALGIASTSTVHGLLTSLEKKGYIRRDPAKPRAIELLDPARQKAGDCVYVPVIGRITAGLPVLAAENLEGFFPLPLDFASGGEYFILRVEGESMSGAGIENGDYVVVRRQDTVDNGEIAVILLGDEATVKRFFREKDSFRLQPENQSFEPVFTREAEILGKVTAIFRKLP